MSTPGGRAFAQARLRELSHNLNLCLTSGLSCQQARNRSLGAYFRLRTTTAARASPAWMRPGLTTVNGFEVGAACRCHSIDAGHIQATAQLAQHFVAFQESPAFELEKNALGGLPYAYRKVDARNQLRKALRLPLRSHRDRG